MKNRGYILCFYIIQYLFIAPAVGKDAGYGKVRMRGSIIETACNISINSLNQTVDFGTITIGEVTKENHSISIPLNIKLINCSNNESSKGGRFEITFDGNHRNNLFLDSITEHGIGLAIYDRDYKRTLPGVPSHPKYYKSEGNILKYYLCLELDGKDIKPGKFHASIKYKIDYF